MRLIAFFALCVLVPTATICRAADPLFPVRIGKDCGYINNAGKLILPAVYPACGTFSEGLAQASGDEGVWSYIDVSGAVVLSKVLAVQAGSFHEGRAYVEVDEKHHYGFIDRAGNMVVKPAYLTNNHNGIYKFSDGLAPVLVGDKWGFIDVHGGFAIPPQYDDATGFTGGTARVTSGDQFLSIDKTGAVLLRTTMAFTCFCGAALAPVQVGDLWGYIDEQGKVAIAPRFEAAAPFEEGLARVWISGKVSFIDQSGKVAFHTDADYAYGFSDGFWRLNIGRKQNFVDKHGRLLRPDGYWSADDFSNGLARVSGGYIDHSGKYVWGAPDEKPRETIY